MFNLRDFPDKAIFSRMQEVYPQLDPDAVSGFLRLLVAGSDFLTRLDNFLADYGIRHGRWLVLIMLRRREVWRALPSELAEEQGVTRATMSGLLRQLERDALVERQNDPSDGRKAMVALTEKGDRLIDTLMPHYYGLLNELMAPLDMSEKQTLVGLLDKVLVHRPGGEEAL